MTYKYNELSGYQNNVSMPSDAMKVNGEYLESLVDGYQQLVISGRGILAQEVEHLQIPGKDGAHLVRAYTSPRILTIQYKLYANTSEELRAQYNALNGVLRGALDITFDDESGWHYYGMLNTSDSPPENSLSVVSSFTIFCADPYAYSEVKTSNPVTLEYADAVLPKKITVKGANQDNIKISNGVDELIIFGGHTTSDTIIIEWTPEEVLVTKNGNNALTYLSWLSIPEMFYLTDGAQITVTNGTLSKVEWRDRKL